MSKPAPKRLSLVERQQKLLEEKGFSRAAQPVSSGPAPTNGDGASNAPSFASFRSSGGSWISRQDEMLIRQGRANAAAASRVAAPMPDAPPSPDGDQQSGEQFNDAASVVSTPSLHPSVARSIACSESTIGAGDATLYWDYQHRTCMRVDLGHKCRECRQPFTRVGEPITERRGARVSMRYHAECFSGFADPRSQARSSHHEGNLAGSQFEAAPAMPSAKMRTSSHFSTEQGPLLSSGGGGGVGVGKNPGTQFAMGRLGFAPGQSSRGVPFNEADALVPPTKKGTNSGLTADALAGMGEISLLDRINVVKEEEEGGEEKKDGVD